MKARKNEGLCPKCSTPNDGSIHQYNRNQCQECGQLFAEQGAVPFPPYNNVHGGVHKFDKPKKAAAPQPFDNIFKNIFGADHCFPKSAVTDETPDPDCANCSGIDCDMCATGGNYGIILDLKAVLDRIAVLAVHCHDITEAHQPDNRILPLLNEVHLLTRDGLERISQSGVDF